MDAIPRFTDSDISSLKEAKEALYRIDCRGVTCPTCPLHIEVKHGCMCMANYLGNIASKAELERRAEK